jgi:hypothetical protein
MVKVGLDQVNSQYTYLAKDPARLGIELKAALPG